MALNIGTPGAGGLLGSLPMAVAPPSAAAVISPTITEKKFIDTVEEAGKIVVSGGPVSATMPFSLKLMLSISVIALSVITTVIVTSITVTFVFVNVVNIFPIFFPGSKNFRPRKKENRYRPDYASHSSYNSHVGLYPEAQYEKYNAEDYSVKYDAKKKSEVYSGNEDKKKYPNRKKRQSGHRLGGSGSKGRGRGRESSDSHRR